MPFPHRPDTDRPQIILEFCTKFCAEHHGRFPNTREISRGADPTGRPIPISIVSYHLHRLVAAGKLGRDGHYRYIPGSRWSPPKEVAHAWQ